MLLFIWLRGTVPYIYADLAQLAEQRFRKAWVVGSIPTVGSNYQLNVTGINPCLRRQGRCPSLPAYTDESHMQAEVRF
jgi:hypothetical protein